MLCVVAWGQALVKELLRVLASRSVVLVRQTQHRAWADALSHAQLLLCGVTSACHLLHPLQMVLLLLYVILLMLLA